MQRDFTFKLYYDFLRNLISKNYKFTTFFEFFTKPNSKSIILRHDVDKLPQNSLMFSEIENELGISGTYNFRILPESFDEKIIQQIANLGHEIGYHYEDIDLAYKCLKSEIRSQKEITEVMILERAIELFEKHLEKLRKLFPVKTICMHGSPKSKYDSKDLWKHYNYQDFGIIGEPYFDVDFSEVFYLTDTGRRWDGDRVSVRDKVKSQKDKVKSNFSDLQFRHTKEIIKAAEECRLPDKLMFTFHPQRWTDKPIPWLKELVWQNIKNVIKYYIIKFRK